MLLKDLFIQQRALIDDFFDRLDLSEAHKILQEFQECKGIIFFTGVGKSGFVAQKIASTLTSTGTRALYISATDALHGDIGLVTEQDIFVLHSASGETEELINLVPHLRKKTLKIILITCESQSRLAKACDLVMNLPLKRELCPFDLAPTTSTLIQMMFGDVIAMALMQMKKFSIDQYASNHPAGRIGKRVTLKVKDIMLKEDRIPTCQPHDKLVDVLHELSNKQAGCVLVVDPKKTLLGIFTDGDLRRALQSKGPQVLDHRMESLMSHTPKWTSQNTMAWDAMKYMEADSKKLIMVLPVIEEDKKVVGLIKLHDILQAGM